ncbi:hypothetical protein [Allobranchiibius sp. GilTou38]|uniref:hypothetical protein n=1 Tax=Allobranchiibius sp. GilTou38 TaxID=2815210 RepID=UPI001AA11A54|nr:hypothetical protein [Allobranchiibius sp. GilTou38]MBO1768270.1 hypothetical protein [Allobranchiibius sp. GilTou38]
MTAAAASCTSTNIRLRQHTSWVTITAPEGVGTRTYQLAVSAAQDSPATIAEPSVRLDAGRTKTVRVSWPADFGWLVITVNGGTLHGALLSNAIYQEGPDSAPDPKLYTDCSSAANPGQPPTPSPVTTALGVTG